MSSLYELNNLHNGNHQKGQAEGDSVFRPADRGEAESIGQKRDLEQSGRQDQRADHGGPQNLVLPPQAENGSSLRTEVEGMEYLAHGHDQKRHRHPVPGRAYGQREDPAFKETADEIGEDR